MPFCGGAAIVALPNPFATDSTMIPTTLAKADHRIARSPVGE
jgi:hypothetical protein